MDFYLKLAHLDNRNVSDVSVIIGQNQYVINVITSSS